MLSNLERNQLLGPLVENRINPIAVIDIETTGVNIKSSRIVELAVLKFLPSGEVEEKVKRINPGIKIPDEATEIHGITDDDVRYEPSFSNIAKSLVNYLHDCDFMGFNAKRFDLPVLREEFARCGIQFSFSDRQIIDPMKIFHMKEPRDLTAAYAKYTGKTMQCAHSALADADACIEILIGQMEAYPDLGSSIQSIGEACHLDEQDWLDQEGRIRTSSEGPILAFGKYSGKLLRNIIIEDLPYLEWILSSDFDSSVKDVINQELVSIRQNVD